jgi:hypothetical protein
VGGEGSITEFNGLLVVSQTTRRQREVARLLETLRRVAKLDGDKNALPKQAK